MKKVIRKYFLTSLALFLVFSNFSFSTTYMLCDMSGGKSSCCCNHNKTKNSSGLSFFKEKSTCCSEGTIELSNSNLLTTVKTEQPSNIFSFAPVVINVNDQSFLSNYNNFIYITQIEHVPKSGIPVLNSSLLI